MKFKAAVGPATESPSKAAGTRRRTLHRFPSQLQRAAQHHYQQAHRQACHVVVGSELVKIAAHP